MRKQKKSEVSKLIPRMCDIHVHVGRFSGGMYFSPEYVVDSLRRLGVKKWAVSSTTTWEGDIETAQSEIRSILDMAHSSIIPLLWVTPGMIERSPDLEDFRGIPYGGIKIHPYGSSWWPDDPRLYRVFSIAKEKRWPILMHTGWTPESEAGRFLELYRAFPELTVVLAHGRPLKQAIEVAQQCRNIYIDISFMPLENIYHLVNVCGPERIVFGSDFPVERYYYRRSSPINRYRRRINSIVRCFGESHLVRWGNEHFEHIFNEAD